MANRQDAIQLCGRLILLLVPDLRSAFLLFRLNASAQFDHPLSDDERLRLVNNCQNALKTSLAKAREPPRDDASFFTKEKAAEFQESFLAPVQRVVDEWGMLIRAGRPPSC